MPRLLFETLGALLLFATALYALRAGRASSGQPATFSLLAGVGTFYLAVDELFSLHERLGHALYYDFGWREPPGVNHFDDLLTMVIALAGLTVVAVYRDEILRERAFARPFAAGLALFAAAIAWDARANPSAMFAWWTEESLELAGAAAMVGAFRIRLLSARGWERELSLPEASAGAAAAPD